MKIKHIVKKQDFTAVFEGEKTFGKNFILYAKRGTNNKDVFNIGVVLPKKFAPKAVIRNYIRRRTYAFFQNKNALLLSEISVVLYLRKDIRDFKRKDLKKIIPEELSILFSKAKIER